MENMKPNETTEFLWRRSLEECPTWAIGVPVLFAFLVLALIVMFREDKKLLYTLVGGAVVGVASIVYLALALLLVGLFKWVVILIPTMAVALFYVGMMYIRDAKSVHFLWAFFLGLLRTTVYMILAVVFMLPGCQHSDRQEYQSKVVFLFDVSGSMHEKDGKPSEGQDLEKNPIPSRQDLIRKFLVGGDTPFIDRVVKKTSVTAFRFGPGVDETEIKILPLGKERPLSDDDWRMFLRPDTKDEVALNRKAVELIESSKEYKDEDERRKALEKQLALFTKRLDMVDTLLSGTNIGGSCLQAHKLENTSYIQAIIVVSDGQSNVGSDDARIQFLERVNNPRQPIPVITIGVGEFRLPVSIRIDDIYAPEETRPDDPFTIKVPVIGAGLHNVQFEVTVELQRIKDVTGKVLPEGSEKKYTLEPKKGVFTGQGDYPQGTVQFEIDVQAPEIKNIKAKDDKLGELEGEWHLWAKVARHKEEAFAEPFHVTEPVKVTIQKRALRVLLFAGSATREYQFLRTILYREMNEKRMEMCIHNQSTVGDDHIDQDVEPERMLQSFPNRLGANEPGQKFMSLNDYDVIIAFDPDWTKLTKGQLQNLEKWVEQQSGGIIFVAGPIFSHQVPRPAGNEGIEKHLSKIYPVVLKDARLHGLGGTLGHDTSRPYALHFAPDVKDFEFMKLDEAGKSPTAGWNAFFWNDEDRNLAMGHDDRPKRGFYQYYPVERIKPASRTIAAFAGSKESRIGDKTDAFKDQQPFMVAMRYGSGQTLYIGSGEFWRLRAFKDGYHERLWIKMARYVAAGAIQQKKYGRIIMARNLPVGTVNFEAQIKGKDGNWQDMGQRPTVFVRRIDKGRPDAVVDPKDKDKKAPKIDDKQINKRFDLVPKPGESDWQGYFVGSINLRDPGDYEFQLPIPGLPGESLRANLHVRKPNPELDNVRTNFPYLYQLASDSKDLLNKLPEDQRKKLEKLLQQAPTDKPGENPGGSKRLFFPLASADAVADCLRPVQPKTETIKGRLEDLWDGNVRPIWVGLAASILLGIATLVGTIIWLVTRQWITAVVWYLVGNVVTALPLLLYFVEGHEISVFWAALLTPLVIAVIGAAILLTLRQWVSALLFVGICATMALGMAIAGTVFDTFFAGTLPVNFSYLLMVVVSLLGIEWLARKLLRLA
jgi:hypothetical protein